MLHSFALNVLCKI
jgi:hypothetical protein